MPDKECVMCVRVSLIVICLLLLSVKEVAAAAPCASLRAQPDAWVAREVDALVRSARAAYDNDDALPAYERVLDQINDGLNRCLLARDEKFVSSHRTFVEYVNAASLGRLPDHELGFNVPDKQYFAETRGFVQIPAFLLDPVFLRDVSRFETLGRAKTFLRLLNVRRAPTDQLVFFSYASRHLGTPDNDDSFRRLLIVVPGDAGTGVPEKWVQFGITDPGARTRIRNVSVVSALLKNDGTFDAYFKDFYRTYRRDGSFASIGGRWELGYGDDNCAECHKSGILPIFPEAGSVRREELPALEEVNRRFRAYGSPRFDKYLDGAKFGPGLSSASLEARSRRFGVNFEGTVVARAMSCVACHQTRQLGALNWPMDRVLVSSYVKGGRMPYGFTLTAPERAQLYDNLIREYFATDPADPGILKSWLLSNGTR
ncbi:MAG: hypothetical protein ACJ741_00770 [Pyrinomonadaceae bacterium]